MAKRLDFIAFIFFFTIGSLNTNIHPLPSTPAPEPPEKLPCIMDYLSVQRAKMKAYQTLKFLQEFSLYFVYGMEVGNLIGQDSEKEENV